MSISPPTEAQVLIVGAGPNGMACAITLASTGLKVMLVDASPEGKFGSRAALVHPRTLEELDAVGLAKPLLDIGIHSKGVTFHGGAETLIAVDVSQLHAQTQFPTTLLIPQYSVEKAFQERLAKEGMWVEREKKAVGMKEASNERGVEVSFEDGSSIIARYVVGADGARSTIRRLAGIDFQDPHTGVPYDVNAFPASALQIVLADVYFEEPLPPKILRDSVSWHLNGRLLFCPLPPEGKGDQTLDVHRSSFWRIAIVIAIGAPAPPRHPDLAYLQAEIDTRNPWAEKVTIMRVTEAATYRVRSAVASTFFKKLGAGNVLLVGDAAHVHSPTGGQGMNLGLCDAVALGRAIRGHLEINKNGGEDVDELLIKYSASRQKTAIKVIGMVKKLTAVINASPGWKRMIRNIVMWVAGRVPLLRNLAAWRLSGLVHRDA